MATQSFLWIVLPNGTSGTGLKLSVFVAPRLDPQHPDGSDGTLAEFTFGNWASRMTSLSVSVLADSHAAPIPATADATSPPPDPSLWDLIFPSMTLVRPFRFDDLGDGVEVVSYPVSVVNGTISRIYGGTIGITPPRGKIPIGCVSPVGKPGGKGGGERCGDGKRGDGRGRGKRAGGGGGHPPGGGGGGGEDCSTLNALEEFLTLLNGLESTLIEFARTPKTSRGESASSRLARLGVTLTPLQRAFFDFQRFFNRYGLAAPPNPPSGPVPGWTDTALRPKSVADFHTIVGLLGDHPLLLRRLGLVRDFTIDASILGAQTTGLRLAVTYPAPPGPAVTVNVSPKTMARIDPAARWFRAADRPGAVVEDGMLKLDDTATFSVEQGQPDGAAAKVYDAATNDLYRVNPTLPRYVKTNGLLTLAPPGQFAGIETCSSIHPSTSLAALRSGVQVVQIGRAEALQGVFARQAEFNRAPGDAVLFSDDVMRGYRVDVRDRGDWRSLCARVGTVALSSGGATTTVSIADEGYVKAASGTKKDKFPFELFVHESLFGWDSWSLVAPLPGLTVSDPTDPGHTPGQYVKRIENTNVDAGKPQVFSFSITTDLHATPGTLPRLRFGNSYRFRARAVDLAGNSLPLGEVREDHATPSWTYLRFEPLPSPVVVPTARFTPGESLEHVVIRAEQPQVSARFIAPPKASQREVETHGKLDPLLDARDFVGAFNVSTKESGSFLDPTFFSADANAVVVTSDPHDPEKPVKDLTRRGQALSPAGAYMIYKGDSLPLPYLPDPLATGIALYVDRNGAPVTRRYEGPSWDDVAPIRFELHAAVGPGLTAAAGSGGAPFVVSLPPATILDVDYASTMPPSQLELMWAWRNRRDAALSAADAASGQAPQIAAHRTLRLVHAVKKPLAKAALTGVSLERRASDTFVTIAEGTGTLRAHSRSTGEVEVWAEWTETQDLLPGKPRIGVARRAFAYRASVPYDSDTVSFPVAPQRAVVDPTACGLTPNAPAARIEFGDTKYRAVRFRCTASTRYAEYYDPADVADPAQTTLVGDLSTTSYVARCSARGPKPDVAYVVPTFGWRDTSRTRRTRIGGGLRIYLDRPWFVTGEGELLAVLVANVSSGSTDVGDTVRPYVSEWGYDPVYADTFSIGSAGDSAFTTLTASRILSADARGNDPRIVTLAELSPPVAVVAVGHTVHYSEERDLWYTDVELDIGGAYTPFVRLAVARYQPNSVQGLELSRVVRIDCVQLASSRTASIARVGGALRVTVIGPSASNLRGLAESGPIPGAGHVMTATVDERQAGGGELDWRPVTRAGVALSVTLTASGAAASGTTKWMGTIVDAPTTAGGTEYRVRIEEIERFAADAGGVGSRPVYIDTLRISI